MNENFELFGTACDPWPLCRNFTNLIFTSADASDSWHGQISAGHSRLGEALGSGDFDSLAEYRVFCVCAAIVSSIIDLHSDLLGVNWFHFESQWKSSALGSFSIAFFYFKFCFYFSANENLCWNQYHSLASVVLYLGIAWISGYWSRS